MLLQHGAKRAVVDRFGRTALHYVLCSDEEQKEQVRLIVKELVTTSKRSPNALSAFVDRRDNKGKTALHRAAHHGQLSAVQTLLHCQASVMITDQQGSTPLIAAASAKDVDEVSTTAYNILVIVLYKNHLETSFCRLTKSKNID